MSKVFNKRRIDSIKNVEIKRYLIYSIGEILIVAIGIFLAIYLNNLKEKEKNKKYINKVLIDAKTEAKRYIRHSIFFLDYNVKRDALVHKILTDKVQIEDYNLLGNISLTGLETIVKLDFDTKPLENLNRRIDYLSNDEKKVYDILSLISSNQEGYEFISENAIENLNDYRKFQKENNEWYYLIDNDTIAEKKEFEYRLKSFEYKNFIRDYAYYEIYCKSQTYTHFQASSCITLFKIMEAQTNQKLKSNEVDSIFTSLNLKKMTKNKCDTVYNEHKKTRKLLKGINLYSLIYNASKDTILVKKEDGVNVARLVPKGYTSVKMKNGTSLHVLIGGKCVAKYRTKINSCLFYE